MDRLFRFQVSIVSLMTALLVGAANEFKLFAISSSAKYSAIVISASLVVSVLAAPSVLQWLIGFKRVRKLIFGQQWIEGYWYIYSPDKDIAGASSPPAIMEISFKSTDFGYQTVGHRIIDDRDVFSFSHSVVAFGYNNMYVSVAASSAHKPLDLAVAYGYFFRSPGGTIVDTYEGVVLSPSGLPTYRQRARRIDDKTVRECVKKHKGDWIKVYLSGFSNGLPQGSKQ